jgi:UDP-glucose:(heptosyl)LPS alpha-1,3-glucosyltransferase
MTQKLKAAVIRRRIHSHGGVEGYALRLIQGLKEKGVEVAVLAEEYEPEEGVKFYPVKIRPFSFIPAPILFNRYCQKIINREKFNLVHSLERTWPQDIYRAGEGCHAEFMKTLPLKDRLNPKHFVTLYTERKAFLSSAYIMANSERVKSEIITHYGVPRDRIAVIYTGVDIERFNPEKASLLREDTREKMGLDKEEIVILFIGSGFRRKGLAFLIKALARVNAFSLKLLIAGKGNFTPYLKLAKSLGIKEKIQFLGLVKDIDSLYASADFLVLPSLYEPFSNVCLEAMASGIPVLTTRANGVSEILGEELKDLIIENPFDTEEIARKVTALTAKDARQSFSIKAREVVQKFSFSRHLDEVIKLYELVFKNKGLPCFH